MNKLLTALIIPLFLVILVSGCTSNENQTDNSITLEELGIEFISLSEFNAMATNLNSPSECETADSKNDCIIDTAVDEDDISYCSFAENVGQCIYNYIRLTGTTDMKYCGIGMSDFCIFSVALSAQNPDYCFSVNANNEIIPKSESEKNYPAINLVSGCIRDIAISKNDISMCEKIPDINVKELCEAVISQDSEKCISVENDLSISSKWMASSCLDNIAFLKNDISICEKISDEDFKRYCIASISKNISECERDDRCIKLVATRLNDTSICDDNFLDDSPNENGCYAIVNKDADKCYNSKYIFDCKFEVNLFKMGLNVNVPGTILKK